MHKYSTSNMSDSELVELFAKNEDKTAFAELYHRYFDDVYRFVYSRLGSKDMCEEIVSDTFETLLHILDHFDNTSKLKTFIIGIALNKLRQYWNKNKKRIEIQFDETFMDSYFEEEIENCDIDTYEEEETKLDKHLNTILDQLPENYRQVLIQRYVHAKDIKNTAQILGITSANVRVIQHRALKKAQELASNLMQTIKSDE